MFKTATNKRKKPIRDIFCKSNRSVKSFIVTVAAVKIGNVTFHQLHGEK